MHKCLYCEKSFEKYSSLNLHAHRTHGINPQQFYVDYHLKGVWLTCKCGCGEKVEWSYALKGFCEYRQGHIARIKNNWGHNQKAIDASAETRRERFASGEITTWNNGLTVEIDERVRNNGKAVSEAFSQERKNRYSDIMSKNRLNGKIPTLRGKDHSQWKGGVSEINVLARARTKLYHEWKYPILVRDGFKCVKCGATQNLHVHHDKEQMCEIVAKHIVDEIDPMPFELKEAIADKVVEYHITNNVPGVTLCSKCHNEIHPSLNFD